MYIMEYTCIIRILSIMGSLGYLWGRLVEVAQQGNILLFYHFLHEDGLIPFTENVKKYRL